MESSLHKNDTHSSEEIEMLAVAAGLPQVMAPASQCALQHTQMPKSSPQDASLGDMEQQVIALTANKKDLSRCERRRLAKLVDKVKLQKALAMNKQMFAEHGVKSELAARLSAIEPIIEAKLLGSNCSGSARAMRNIAEHDFDIKFSDVTQDKAQALQRNRKAMMQTGPMQLDEAHFRPEIGTRSLFYFAVDGVNLAACWGELAGTELHLEIQAIRDLNIATYRMAAFLADMVDDLEMDTSIVDGCATTTFLSESLAAADPITVSCLVPSQCQQIAAHLLILGRIAKFAAKDDLESAIEIMRYNLQVESLLWSADAKSYGSAWMAECTCDLGLRPCRVCDSGGIVLDTPGFLDM